jgi:hypothetical protein
LQLMQTEKKLLWVTLLKQHTSLLDQQLSYLDKDLADLQNNREPMSPTLGPAISPATNAAELAMLADALNRGCEDLDQQLMAGFTLAPSNLLHKPNIAIINRLITDIRTRDQLLGETVDHLSHFAQAEHIK